MPHSHFARERAAFEAYLTKADAELTKLLAEQSAECAAFERDIATINAQFETLLDALASEFA